MKNDAYGHAHGPLCGVDRQLLPQVQVGPGHRRERHAHRHGASPCRDSPPPKSSWEALWQDNASSLSWRSIPPSHQRHLVTSSTTNMKDFLKSYRDLEAKVRATSSFDNS